MTRCHFTVVVSVITENIFDKLLSAPVRIGMNDSPSPSTRALTKHFYPRAEKIAEIVCGILDKEIDVKSFFPSNSIPLDIPDPTFKGPF